MLSKSQKLLSAQLVEDSEVVFEKEVVLRTTPERTGDAFF